MAADLRDLPQASHAGLRAGSAETLLGLFADWYWVLDKDLRYVHISGQGDQRNKVNASTLLGQRRFEGREFEPLDMGKAEFERLHAEGRSYRDVRARIRVKDGSHHYISISGEPLRDASGALTGYHGVTRDITKEYLTQAALAESEARFRSLADLSSDYYWETDAEHRFVHRAWGEGNAPGPMVPDAVALGKRRWEVPSLAPDAAGWRVLEQAMDAHRPFRGFEFSRLDAEGNERHFTVSGEPVFDSGGAFKGYRGVGTDITARKRDERLLALEHEVTRRLALAPSAAEGLRAVIRAICDAQGWDYGRYWKLDEAAGVLRFGTAWSVPDPEIERYLEESRGLTFAPGVAIVGEVLRTGEPVLVADLSKDGRLQQKALAERAGLRGACNFAVNAEGRTVGVLAFVGRIAREDDPRLLSAMGAIGRQVGQFLRRKEAEDEVRSSEARFRSLVALSSDFYWESDREHRITVRTGGAAHTLDQAGGSVVFGKRRWELATVAPDAAGWDAHRADLEAHRVFRDFEFAWAGGDGKVYHLAISGEPVFDAEGGFAGYRGIGSDITARKREEQLLAIEHEVTRRLAGAPDAASGVRAVLQAIGQAQGWTYGRFWRLDEATGGAYFGADWSIPDPEVEQFLAQSRGTRYAPGTGIIGEVLQSGEPQFVPDLRLDPRLVQKALPERTGVRGACCFAVTAEGRAVGVLAFVGREVRRGDPRTLGAMAAIGRQVGQFLRRKQAEDEVRSSEARFRSLIALSSDFYWETDAMHRMTVRSEGGAADSYRALGGRGLMGKCRWEMAVLESERANWEAHRADLEAHRPFRDFQYTRPADDGVLYHFSISGEPFFGNDGRFLGYRGVGTDITARKREQRQVELEHHVARALAESDDAAGSLQSVLRAICEGMDWEFGRYWQVDEAAGVLRLGAAFGAAGAGSGDDAQPSREVTFARGAGLAGRVWQSGKPLWVQDVRDDARVLRRGLADTAGMRGVFLFPVAAGGRTLGVMAFSSRHVREPDQRMLDMVTSIGGQVGQSLQRLEAQAVLAQSEDRYRHLTDLAADWYWELDEAARFTYVSRGAGADDDRDALTGRHPWQLGYTNFDDAKWDHFRAEFAARRMFRDIEAAWTDRDGSTRIILVSGYPVHDARGEFRGYRGISRDITERRREERLHALEHEVAHALTESGEPVQAVERVMRAVCEVSGFDCARYFRLDAASGMMRQAGGWSADPALLERFVTQAAKRDFAPGEGVVGEVWRSGHAIWVEDIARDPRFVNAAAAGNSSLRTGFTVPIAYDGRIEGVLTFLCTRQRAEDELVLRTARAVASQLAQFLARTRSQELLRENEERFRSLTELSSDWYWEQDAELRFVNFSGGNIPQKWGVDQLNAIGKRRWEIPGVAAISCSWEAHRADLEARRPYRDFVYMRVHRETGQPHYVSASGYPVFDAEGRFTGYRGVASDVTERKREELLRALEHRVSAVLAVEEDADSALAEVVHAACKGLGIDCGRYFQADEAAGELRFVGGWGIPEAGIQRFLEASRRIRYRAGEGIAGAVWQSGEPIWIADVRQDARAAGSVMATTTEMRFLLVIPVVADGRVHGTLSFASRQMTAPDERLLKALVAVGGQLGQFLGRARSQAELRRSNARLELHARRQERIAGFGQFALRRQGADQLIEGALQALGADVETAVFFERDDQGRLRLREGRGPEVAESIGKTAPLIPGGAALRVLDGGETVRVEDAYFSALPEGLPWAGWIRRMRSGVYVPVTHNGHAHGMIALFSEAPGAFEDDDVRFAESIGHVLSAALQREQAEQRLAIMAQFDSLTGLPNRGLLEDRLRQTMAQSRRKQWQTGVLFVDLDRFKLVNDTLGHPVGDRLLREVSGRLQLCVRADDTVGRISGDEFAIVLADLRHPEDAAQVAQKVLDALAQPFALEASEVFVSASIGISVYPADGEDAETLLRNADMAMYRAKKASRNAYRFFTAKMNERTARKLQLGTDLRRAIDRREFTLHYQPKVELAGGTLVGMEALLRWNHPARGLVSPAEFVPALEESGLIMPVGEWVLEEACAQLKRWRDAGYVAAPVSINLSPKQFRRQDLDKVIQRALEAAGLPPALLELEITESSIADDAEQAVAILRNLRAAGMAISVDDFGTGYSSLAYLTRLPISSLKIDRSFVSGADESPESVSIVRAIIDMAHNMRFTVVAEGVETEWQAKFLRLYNCDQAQGYLFGRPMPAAEIEGRLARAGA